MVGIDFYHLTATPLERALPKLLEKASGAGHRMVLMAPDEPRIQELNRLLWEYDPDSFLPHGSAEDGHAEGQPIYLTHREENPNASDLLVISGGMEPGNLSEYSRVLDMFNGHDDREVSAARKRWKRYQEAGHSLTYWKQKPNGGWEKG